MKSFDYLIIGSNSFSGSSFVNFLLKKNKKVLGVSRSKEPNKVFLSYKNNEKIKNFKFIKIDINIYKGRKKLFRLLKSIKIKYVVNFAAQGMVAESWVNPKDRYTTNVISQIEIIEFLKNYKHIKKYIHFTTPEVYGSTKEWKKETIQFNPSTPYAISRACTDQHLIAINNNFKFPCILTRAANVYGEHQQLYRIIPRSILFPLLNRKITIDGKGNSYRSFIHINDVCDALHFLINKGKIGQTYHISTNKLISIKALVTQIIRKLKLEPKKYIQFSKDRQAKDTFYKLNSNKLRKLGWKDKTSLKQGIEKNILWIKKNISLIKKENFYYSHKK